MYLIIQQFNRKKIENPKNTIIINHYQIKKTKTHIITQQPMKHNFALPFIQNFQHPHKPFVTLNRIQTFLGGNFYVRLSTIYGNMVEAISKKNYRYINGCVESAFAKKLISEINQAENQRYKIKMKMPLAKIVLVKPKKFDKVFKRRTGLWDNNVTKIGLTCNVYYGQEFDREQPYGLQGIKKYRIGQFRYLIYNPSLSFLTNCANLYKHQTYQFIVRYTSKLHLEILSYGEKQFPSVFQNKKQDTEITSEIVMRAGDEKFDWVILDINGLAAGLGK